MKRLRKLISALTFGLLYLAGQGAAPLPNPPVIREIGMDFEVPNSEYVIFLSPGGVISKAFEKSVDLKGKTCIVIIAASAALEILLPSCKERYYVPGAVVQFHSAHAMIPPMMLEGVMISQWDAIELSEVLRSDNERMMNHMLASNFPLRQPWLSYAFKNNLAIAGKGLENLHPWILPVSQCSHCPAYTKMVKGPAYSEQ